MAVKSTAVDPRLTKIDDCLYRVAVKAVIINESKILLVQEAGDDFWSVPGGGIDYNEDTTAALKRELQEEIAVSPEEIHINPTVQLILSGNIHNAVPRLNIFYKVTVPVHMVKAGAESQAVAWFSAQQLGGLTLSPSTGNLRQHLQDFIDTNKLTIH